VLFRSGADGGGRDQGARALDVLGRMADQDARAQRRQPPRHGGFLDVGAADGIAQVQQDLGDAAHARAADADEMDVADAVLHADSSRLWTQASAISCAAFRLASSRAWAATAASSGR